MGKIKRTRTKYHVAKASESKKEDFSSFKKIESPLPILTIKENLFENINIDDIFKAKIDDDTRSVKSSKSNKSTKSNRGPQIAKKEKMKLRRENFLKKIETAKQMLIQSKKRKKIAPLNTNITLPDNLPSIERLLNSKPNFHIKKKNFKGKPTEKSAKLKRKALRNLTSYKKLIKKADSSKNIFDCVAESVREKVKRDLQ